MAPAVLKRPDQKADIVEPVDKAGHADRSDAIARPNISDERMNEGLSMQWHELCFCLTAAHVFYAPYTKVEETPALHAVHDILTYGIGRSALQKVCHLGGKCCKLPAHHSTNTCCTRGPSRGLSCLHSSLRRFPNPSYGWARGST